MQLLKFYLK